jgi:hypothetical protein
VAIGSCKSFWAAVLFVVVVTAASTGRLHYESVRLDDTGQLHIKAADTKELLAPRLPHQARFGEPAISPDHLTIGWLAEFQDTSSPSPIDPDAFTLVVYRNGHITRRVDGDPIVWDWHFERGGKAIAYSTGSRHGGANECVLIELDSGKVLENWPTSSATQTPTWAEELRR